LNFLGQESFQLIHGDVRDVTQLNTAIVGCDAVVHLAALVGEGACSLDGQAASDINFGGLKNAFAAAKDAGVRKFIFSSTCSNYGTTSPNVVADETTPLKPMSVYATSKVAAEQFLVAQDADVDVTVLRFGTICGVSPRMRFDLLVNEMARSAILGHPIKLFAPNAYRPFLHIRDAAAAILHSLNASAIQTASKVFNIVGENYQKYQLADLVAKHFPQTRIEIHGGQPDLRDYQVSGLRAATELEFIPKLTAETALLETADAVKMNAFRDAMWSGYSAMPDSKEAIQSPATFLIDKSNKSTRLNISVFGLGKVGLTLATCLAKVGHRVVGVDLHERHVNSINARSVTCNEPGLRERLDTCKLENLRATTNAEEAVLSSDITFIIVPTPSNTLGGFSLQFIVRAIEKIGAALMRKDGRHVVAVVGTVLPGASEHIIIPRLEESSSRKLGDTLGYCYNPSYIALGEIVKGIESPDYVLIGESDTSSGNLVLLAHKPMNPEGTPVARMNIIEAEITKLASNTHETMRVSFANMLCALCTEIPGANVDKVTEALAHRMGKRFFRGAVPYGGPCWPRDNEALAVFMDAVGVPSRMPRNVDLFNEEHGKFILKHILALTSPETAIGVVGLSYKPGTPVIEASFGANLSLWLAAERRPVIAWDPLAMSEAAMSTKDRITFAKDGNDCLMKADTIVIVNPMPELAELNWEQASEKTVIDCWRCLPAAIVRNLGRYVMLGSGSSQSSRKEWLSRRLGAQLRLLCS
jgi:UDPglucose 6-dehydrogenase